jgi:hypothetical protein
MKRAKKEDLRWFGFVLLSAHNHRPRFLLSPKDKYMLVRGQSAIEEAQLEAKLNLSPGGMVEKRKCHAEQRNKSELEGGLNNRKSLKEAVSKEGKFSKCPYLLYTI